MYQIQDIISVNLNNHNLCNLYLNAAKQKNHQVLEELERDFSNIIDVPRILIAHGMFNTFIWLKENGFIQWYIDDVIPYAIFFNQLEIVKWGCQNEYPLHNSYFDFDLLLSKRKQILRFMHSIGYRNLNCIKRICSCCKTNLLNEIWNDFDGEYIYNIQWLPFETLEDIFFLIEFEK